MSFTHVQYSLVLYCLTTSLLQVGRNMQLIKFQPTTAVLPFKNRCSLAEHSTNKQRAPPYGSDGPIHTPVAFIPQRIGKQTSQITRPEGGPIVKSSLVFLSRSLQMSDSALKWAKATAFHVLSNAISSYHQTLHILSYWQKHK